MRSMIHSRVAGPVHGSLAHPLGVTDEVPPVRYEQDLDDVVAAFTRNAAVFQDDDAVGAPAREHGQPGHLHQGASDGHGRAARRRRAGYLRGAMTSARQTIPEGPAPPISRLHRQERLSCRAQVRLLVSSCEALRGLLRSLAWADLSPRERRRLSGALRRLESDLRLALLAAGFTDLGPRVRAAFALAVALLWGYSLQHHYFDPRYGREDMRSAGALLRARAAAGERIVAANTEDLLFYYYRGPVPITTYWLGWAADPVARSERLDRLIGDAPGAWVVLSRGEDLDPTGAFERHLDERHPTAERFRFEGVRVWHLRRSAPTNEGPAARS